MSSDNDEAPFVPVPAVQYETVSWQMGDEQVSRRQRARHSGTSYEAAVPPTIAALAVETRPELSAEIEDARAAVERFDQKYGHLAPVFAAILLRSESAASSHIENLTASPATIAEATLGIKTASNASLIVANTRSMAKAAATAGTISAASILTIHDALMADSNPRIAGEFRDQQVWIGGSTISPLGAAFVPPTAERVPGLITDLVDFMDRTDVPVISHLAIAHAQFETIHPFPDGNGRTGRTLMHSMLRAAGITTSITIPLSSGLLADVSGYHAALDAYRQGNAGPIIATVTRSTFSALQNATSLVDDIEQVRDDWNSALVVRRDSSAHRLLDAVITQPVISSTEIARILDIDVRNAPRALRPLAEAGILVKRGRLWAAPEVLTALERFSQRSLQRRSAS